MPLYDYRCSTCNDAITRMMSIANRFLPESTESCPQCGTFTLTKTLDAPAMGDSVRLGVRSTDAGFKEVLSKIAEKVPKSNLRDKLSR